MAEDALICMVEIPMGSRNKYEFDPALGAIKFDRFVSASVVYPTDYGFVPETLALDGDELDVLVCVSEPTFPGCLVPVNPLGMFCMRDENGPDDKVVCVPVNDPRWNVHHQVEDLPQQLRDEIFHFFTRLQGPRPRPALRADRVDGPRHGAAGDRRGPGALPRAEAGVVSR